MNFMIMPIIYVIIINLSKPLLVVGGLAAGGLGTGMLLQPKLDASGDVAPPSFDWSHNGILSSLDHARYDSFNFC